MPADECLSAPPCPVGLDPGVRIISVAAGARHTLALSLSRSLKGNEAYKPQFSDMGAHVKMVSSPHLIPCIEPSSYAKDGPSFVHQGGTGLAPQALKVPGSSIKAIACGGGHSAVLTDAGALLSFGWGPYGQIYAELDRYSIPPCL